MYASLSASIQRKIKVTSKELEIILGSFRPLSPGKNEILLRRGEPSERMYFVDGGCLRIFFLEEDGQEVTRYLAFENDFATALTGFITEAPSQEFIQALEHTRLLYITRINFHTLLTAIPAWEKFYRHYLEYAYVNNTNRLISFVTLDATQRYQLLVAQSPAIVQRLSNKIVASYLNISQETLSRIKSKR